MAQIPSQFDQIGRGEPPGMNIGYRDDAVGGDEGVGALDNHVARGIDEYQRRVVGVRIHQPDDDRDVVGDAVEIHRDGAVGLEEIDGAAVVVGEGGGLGLQRRVGFSELHQMLPDVPLHPLRVRQRRRAALGEHAVEKLLGELRHSVRDCVVNP